MNRKRVLAVLAATSLFALVGCGSASGTGGSGPGGRATPPNEKMMTALGSGEGQVNVIAWAGYAEDGSDDPTVDWVHPFESQTGCKVNVKIANTSDEMVQLMHTGQYDVVSASGDATLRLVYGGDVAPVNTSLVPNYATIFSFLKDRAWNSVKVNGKSQMYGIPHGWGANLLMWNTKTVTPAPTSWGAVFDANSPYKGKVTAYDSPIYIADAALYLMKSQPALGIKDPYSLDQKQFDAAVALLKTQRTLVGEYWSDYTKEVQAFESGTSVIGTTWQVIANLIQGDKKADVEAIVPTEGSTGWSDTWMISSKSQHPNCAYMWMNWIVSPKVNAEVANWFGEAPAQELACQQPDMASVCQTYHAADQAYSNNIWYWTTPTTDCLDGRTNVKCVPYSQWTQAWTEIKG
ncbi:MAG TPA: ABC transporter substrate-binding protein [Micromonosporaceae bacterium]|jgi:putative spermidine/putrescine transport system substrate-binding protein|nr:ABC transporter substrate-binding protein [Micromonosporaceae bacterium]